MSAFHIDAFIVFLALAFLITAVVRVLISKSTKFIQHVIWMRRRAKGTLLKDLEADYWLKLINRPDYRSIWRWYYGEEWKKKHGKVSVVEEGDENKKRPFARKLVHVNIVLAVMVVVVFLVSTFAGSINIPSTEIPTKTSIKLLAAWNATINYDSESETWLRMLPFTPTSEYVIFDILLSRTDSAMLGERDVFFGVTSGYKADTVGFETVLYYYVLNTTYYFLNDDGLVVDVIDVISDSGEFGLPMRVGPQIFIEFHLVLHMRDVSALDTVLVTMNSTNGTKTIYLTTPDYPYPQPGSP